MLGACGCPCVSCACPVRVPVRLPVRVPVRVLCACICEYMGFYGGITCPVDHALLHAKMLNCFFCMLFSLSWQCQSEELNAIVENMITSAFFFQERARLT